MREIKFRFWDKSKGKMYDWHELPFTDFHEVVAILGAGGELMQFTGLKDKNGHDIYEGDLCVFSKDPLVPPPLTVRFYQGAFTLDEKILLANCFPPEFEIEVIGNVYQNPELLTPKVATPTNV